MNMKFKSLALLCGLLWTSCTAMAEESLVTAIFTPFRQKEIVP
ncbi:MAG: hypothetical protein FD173_1662, partial [Gallionellaceae bacterium]